MTISIAYADGRADDSRINTNTGIADIDGRADNTGTGTSTSTGIARMSEQVRHRNRVIDSEYRER